MLQQEISDGAAGDFLSPSTAALERGFSTMKLICTPLRSYRTQYSLQALMTINIEGPDDLWDEPSMWGCSVKTLDEESRENITFNYETDY